MSLTVTEFTITLKHLIETNFGQVAIQGEISGLSRPSSGHLYFTLKDDQAQVAAVMFRSAANSCLFDLENGMEVILHGRISVYEPRGNYQIIVNKIEPLGEGALQLAFEKLKTKLAKEGLFEPTKKKQLPFLPKGIGIITSPTGAAIQDLINVIHRRFSTIPIFVNPVPVQGDEASKKIVGAIDQFQKFKEVDLLIIGRGGGSIEDLWAFNEEPVVRAIARSKKPIISAVGHEIDFTLSDFAADLRAPTPSAAAELAVPVKNNLINQINHFTQLLAGRVQNNMDLKKSQLESLMNRIRSPKWFIENQRLRIDDLQGRLTFLIQSQLGRKKAQLSHAQGILNSLNPVDVMNRGYAIITNSKKHLVTSVKQVSKNQTLMIHLSDGDLQSKVQNVISKTDL